MLVLKTKSCNMYTCRCMCLLRKLTENYAKQEFKQMFVVKYSMKIFRTILLVFNSSDVKASYFIFLHSEKCLDTCINVIFGNINWHVLYLIEKKGWSKGCDEYGIIKCLKKMFSRNQNFFEYRRDFSIYMYNLYHEEAMKLSIV